MHLSRLFLFENFEIAKAETTSLPELDDARERKEKKMKDNDYWYSQREKMVGNFFTGLKKTEENRYMEKVLY